MEEATRRKLARALEDVAARLEKITSTIDAEGTQEESSEYRIKIDTVRAGVLRAHAMLDAGPEH
jgi:hypothetical protein